MRSILPYLVALVFLFISGLVRTVSRPGVDASWEDFNFGPEAALAALLLALDPGGHEQLEHGDLAPLVATIGLLCALTAIFLTRRLHDHIQKTQKLDKLGWRFWTGWTTSNLLGATCVGLVVWAKVGT